MSHPRITIPGTVDHWWSLRASYPRDHRMNPRVLSRLLRLRYAWWQWRLALVAVAVCVLPALVVGTVAEAASLATAAAAGPLEVAKELGDKSLAYWFVALAGCMIVSWTWMVKWLISQLGEQRKAHAETTAQLLKYLSDDHAAQTVLITRATAVMEELVVVLRSQK